ncbi:MAG: Cu(I)/Ag(I) efflux system membrane fusion protein [Kiritimatiellia bacterium]|jgi:Cu(I)/Ag(I) efflux system membrane fusion protein
MNTHTTHLIVLLCTLLTGALVGCIGASPATMAEQEHADDLYTCGMHPQVVQEGPGSCPICGMNLTPMNVRKSTTSQAPPSGERKIVYWRAPMDPSYVRDVPGKSPMGMDLVPVYEDELKANGDLVEIDPGVIQQMGVETSLVERTTVFRHIRTIGEVEVGEDELTVVNLRFSGWVERIYVDRTGDEVKAGQVLFDIYSPELVAAQQEYLLALHAQGADAPLTKSARRKLELWNLSERDIRKVATSGEASRTMPIRSPQAGFVLHKSVVEGARVTSGKDLYRIGNLKRIWVTAEVYEHDAPWVTVGQKAQLELTNLANGVVEGQVAYIYPTMNKRSRTLTVRLEFDNPGVRLKPGMFATVRIQYRRMDDVIAVPTEAILYSGSRTIAFVSHGKGRFEPRDVQTGLQGDHRLIEVTGGLIEGERVVTSGQFLIDSESQLQEALRKILASNRGETTAQTAQDHTVWSCPMHPEVLSDGEGRCPQCGMFLEKRKGTPEELNKVHDKTAEAGQYTCPMHPEVVSDEPGRCPKCGMFLEKVDAGSTDEPNDHAGHKHGGGR